VTGLSLGRIVVGIVSFANPRLAAGMLGLDFEGNPQGSFMARLFGTREIAIGTATLLARGKTRRNLAVVGIGIDLADAATAVLGVQDKTLTKRTASMLVVPALGAAASGAVGLRAAKG
jgi:hypothetical protein